MSEYSQGEGWWQASDGKWYPPELHPSVPAPTQLPPQKSSNNWTIIAMVIGVVVVLAGLAVVFIGRDSGNKKATGSASVSTASGVPDGYQVVTDDTDHASFAVPNSFRTFDLNSSDASSAIDQAASANPDLATSLSQARPLLDQGGRVFAIN